MTRMHFARARRGAAMIEALIVLPVLVALLLGVPMVHERQAALQRALIAARGCAFAHALGGCGQVPAACAAPPSALDAPMPADESDPIVIASRNARGGSFVFDEIPVLGAALRDLLGHTTEARARVQLRPATAQPQSAAESTAPKQPHATVKAAFTLACNERPRDVLAMTKALFCERLPLIDCGGSP
jgi:hypothetical protein